jgi:GntR family transcriptional regulator
VPRSVPLYAQVESVLRQRIGVKRYPPGSAFPTEGRLQKEFAVSRATVRLALDALHRDGLIVRHAGRGTVVNAVAEGPRSLTLKGSLEELIALADGASSELVVSDVCLADATPEEAAELGLAGGSVVTRVTGVRRRGGEVVAYLVVCVPERFGSLLTLPTGAVSPPVIALLREQLGLTVRDVRQTIGVGLADPVIADGLHVAVGTPLLTARRTYLAIDGTPVEFAVSSYAGERFRYEMTIRGSA